MKNEVNTSLKKVGASNVDGKPSKANHPNSHPSNPIHKAEEAESTQEFKQPDPEKPAPT